MTKAITKKLLEYWIDDERKAVKEYTDAGLYKLAADERKHEIFLTRLKMYGDSEGYPIPPSILHRNLFI